MTFVRRPGIIIGLLLIGLVGAAFLTQVVPYRQIIDANNNVEAARQQLSDLETENAVLQADIEALHTNSEIEKLAREKLGYVNPGETAYVVLDPPGSNEPTTPTVPEPPPQETWVDRVWEFLTGADQAG